MPENREEILVATKANIWVAPAGTPLPTSETGSLNGAFINLGYTVEEGSSITYTQSTEDIMAHQSADPVRRIVTARGLSVAFSLEQWNQATFELAFGGGSWTEPSPGTYQYTPPDSDDALAEYAAVLEWQDGDKVSRLCLEVATVSEDVETSLVRTAASVLPITLRALKPDSDNPTWKYLTGDPAFAEAS